MTGRQDQWQVTATAELTPGVPTRLGLFSRLSGGRATAEDTKFRPGGMRAEVSRGGPGSIENITIGREYDVDRDHALAKRLANRMLGGVVRVTVSQQPLDAAGARRGTPTVRSGTLVGVTFPEHDASASGMSMLELEVSIAGSVA